MSDGQAATTVRVTVPVSPTPAPPPTQGVTANTTPLAVGSGPTDTAIVGGRAYVLNTGSNSVSVIDTATHTTVTSIPVGSSPHGLAASPTTHRVYVTNSVDNTMTVIDTSTNSVAGSPIPIPVQYDVGGEGGYIENYVTEIAVSPTGDRVYVTATDGSVSVIHTATNSVVTTTALGSYSDLEVSADGSRLYGTHSSEYNYFPSPAIDVIDTATMTRIAGVASDRSGTTPVRAASSPPTPTTSH